MIDKIIIIIVLLRDINCVVHSRWFEVNGTEVTSNYQKARTTNISFSLGSVEMHIKSQNIVQEYKMAAAERKHIIA
jgi:hypothetical protein